MLQKLNILETSECQSQLNKVLPDSMFCTQNNDNTGACSVSIYQNINRCKITTNFNGK